MDGAAEALAQIRDSGIRVCLITGLSRSLVGLVLDTLGWWRRVDLVLCPEDAPRGYPWPDPMLSAMLRLGVADVRETAYAGGTESGVLCGRRAGAQIVAGVLTGGHTRDRLQRAGATHLLGSIADLPEVLAGRPIPETQARPRRKWSRLRRSSRPRASRYCPLPIRRCPRLPGRMREVQARQRRARLVPAPVAQTA